MIARRALWLLFGVVLACNAITGTGAYEIVDCPNDSCGDGGAPGAGDAESETANADSAADSGAEPLPTCDTGRAPLRLTVTGANGAVSLNGGGLSATAGRTEAACLTTGKIDLRTNGPGADWTGVSCEDGNIGRDRCEFDLGSQGATVTAALP